MARIDLIHVSKTLEDGGRRGARFSIEDLSLTVPDGRTLVILGPSGCGKTTLLKLIAGLITPDAGRVRYDGVDVREAPPGDRRIGMVFQNYALYPHMTSRSNVLSYFLFRKKTPELDALQKAKYERTSELMGVDLRHLLDRKPPTLSGGEKQRVAVARCITRDPVLFLLDEPFSNLDQTLREKYRVSLKLLLRQFDITTVYVTHDHYEALILADLIAIMDRGRIEQIGTYAEIYDEPRNAFVAGFLNRHIGTPSISFLDARDVTQCRALGTMRIGVRPEEVEVSRHERGDATKAVVAHATSLPLINATIVEARVGAHEVHAHAAAGESFQAGDAVWLTFKRYHVFDETGARLPQLSSPAGALPSR
jgi:ABC-type sugar transport system ATPase subunit